MATFAGNYIGGLPTLYSSVYESKTHNGYLLELGASSAGGGDPTITNVTPDPGTTLPSRQTAISFDVQDVDPGLQIVVITLRYTSSQGTFVVHNGTQFLYPFDSAGSTRTPIDNGFHFTVLPRRGWAGDIDQLFVYAVDHAGNLEGSLP